MQLIEKSLDPSNYAQNETLLRESLELKEPFLESLKKRRDMSFDARQFKIDSLWQCTTYLSIIVGALLIARYSIKVDDLLKDVKNKT